ncbi:hypothetical protein PENSPDRAFT_671937 [Peniophora sp. CONT]|nr:hypothetical protein PENSPDRAFT_671937 [Peniophora sp. CONT]
MCNYNPPLGRMLVDALGARNTRPLQLEELPRPRQSFYCGQSCSVAVQPYYDTSTTYAPRLSTQLSLYAGVINMPFLSQLLFYENGTEYSQLEILNDDFTLNETNFSSSRILRYRKRHSIHERSHSTRSALFSSSRPERIAAVPEEVVPALPHRHTGASDRSLGGEGDGRKHIALGE